MISKKMQERVRVLNDAAVRQGAKYVLYWSQMNRRVECNHALAWAVERANALKLPVLYYEGLTCTYREANDRMHTFVLEGVPETQRRLARRGIGYCFYLPKTRRGPGDVLSRVAGGAGLALTGD